MFNQVVPRETCKCFYSKWIYDRYQHSIGFRLFKLKKKVEIPEKCVTCI